MPDQSTQPEISQEAARTPGPWRVNPDKSHPWVVELETNFPGVFNAVATVGYRPNARLIAAAPDLLAALRKAEQQLDYGQYDAAQDILRAAIAAATGEARS